MQRIAVFASGTGTNFQAILNAQTNGAFDAIEPNQQNQQIQAGQVVLLVTDKEACGATAKAKAANVKVAAFQPKAFPSKLEYEQEILHVLEAEQIDWIVLAGYMRLIGPTLLQAYANRIINLHPSLLPSFTGKDAIGQAYNFGVKYTGVTVHFVDEGMDTGPIIAQQPVAIEPDDTIETLTHRIHEIEHTLLPAVLANLLKSKVKIVGKKVDLIKVK